MSVKNFSRLKQFYILFVDCIITNAAEIEHIEAAKKRQYGT